MSIRQIARVVGMSYGGTRKRLHKLGKLRSKAEGRTHYQRNSFSGDSEERAYLLGLRAGDVNAWEKSPNTIEARVSTTHPAMANLFSSAFGNYGHLMRFAEPAYLPGHYRWQHKVHLDRSFDFLVPKPKMIPVNTKEFYRFLAGYSDSECCWCVFPHRARIKASWSVETLDAEIVCLIRERLKLAGFHPSLRQSYHRGHRKKNQEMDARERVKFRLRLDRRDEVVSLARILEPYSLHSEKIAKMQLIISHPRGKWIEIAGRVNRLRRKLKQEVLKHKGEAERAYNARKDRGLVQGVVG